MKCPTCGADGGGRKFCRQCGAPMLPQGPRACPACGADVRPAAKYCFKCGAPQDTSATLPANTRSRCALCGARMGPGVKFCRSCGNPRTSLTGQAIPEMSGAAAQKPTAPPVAGAHTVDDSPASAPPPSWPGAEPELPVSTSAPAEAQAPLSAMKPPRFAPATGLSGVQLRDLDTNIEGSFWIRPKGLAEPEAPRIAHEVPSPSGAESAESARRPTVAALRAVGAIVFLLAAGAASWYLWGVQTIIVASPRADHVFLDNEELPQVDGRFVVPHLSRHPHTLKVQREGYADLVETLNFPLTASTEWITVSLTPNGTR